MSGIGLRLGRHGQLTALCVPELLEHPWAKRHNAFKATQNARICTELTPTGSRNSGETAFGPRAEASAAWKLNSLTFMDNQSMTFATAACSLNALS